jgi:hypothetical protein
MIRGIHGMFYSSESDELRAFVREKLRLPHTDVGEGWLIFDFPEGDLGVHPTDESNDPPSGTHNISFYCDDIHGTVAELKSRGVKFDGEVADHGYGFVTHFTMPGGVMIQLYEPKYQKGLSRPSRTKAAKPARKSAATKVKAKAKAKTKAKPAAKAAPAKRKVAAKAKSKRG